MTASEPNILRRVGRFLHQPFHEKSKLLYARWRKIFPNVPFPVRLPFGAWWIARNDGFGASLTYHPLEASECNFVERFLKPGMTVLDIGAHHGLYTLLASKRVGSSGKVFSFEPSPRERRALRLHLLLNRCKNVSLVECALGAEDSETDLYVAAEGLSGFNSLKPPGITSSISTVRVHVHQLDDWLAKSGVSTVDFIKLDVEGGELSVLGGARCLLTQKPRPIILAEVQDIRTDPWGYKAEEIIRLLEENSYRWFALTDDGLPYLLDTSRTEFEGNFVACPEELLSTFQGTILTTP
jgi:FkbM family methyltransferase